MRIVDDDLETLLTLNMSLEEDKRRRLRIQKRTTRFLNEEAPIITEAELHLILIRK